MVSYEVEFTNPEEDRPQPCRGVIAGFSTQDAAERYARDLDGVVKVVEVVRRTVWIRP